MDIEGASDNELIEAARRESGPEADLYLDALYKRSYPRVAHWCLRICGNRDEAAELAQEVFLRVHSKLESFRMDSRFSTWLYTVTRSVAINRGISRQRRESGLVDLDEVPDLRDTDPGPRAAAEHNEVLDRVRRIMESDLEPLESKVLCLHFLDGLTLPAITQLLAFRNKSGAKAFVVSGIRKLKRGLRDSPGQARRAVECT